jgi:regulator of RNase E activity RraA
MAQLTSELVESLRRLDACTVSNAIERFECRLRNEGFGDGSVRALFDDVRPAVGYAATARIRCSSPPPVGPRYRDRTDWWSYILTIPPPRLVVVEDVDERPGRGAFVGYVHTQILRALGCVAYVTNGSVRDLDAVAPMGFPLLAGSVSVSHAFVHIVDFDQPVTVAGLPVKAGDIVYADRHGFLTIPPDVVDQIPGAAQRMLEHEKRIVALCQSSGFSLDSLRALVRQSE